MRATVILLCWLMGVLPGWAAPTLQRGPYLQMANPSALTVCWRSSQAGTGRVRYGTAANALTNEKAGGRTTNHAIRLTGLDPDTTYYYQIETDTTVLGTGANLHFKTPPVVGTTGRLRFWALGDPGTGTTPQLQVRNAFAPVHAEHPADFWIMLGDDAYPSGTDYNFQIALFNIYQAYLPQLPLWSCIGNHETYGTSDAAGHFAYDAVFRLPTGGECGGVASGTERYYSWDYANVHFISLDSMTSLRTATGPMAAWLEADLNQNLLPWVVAIWHHPPYTKGSHDSDVEEELVEMRMNILPILENHGVDLVLNGHSHSYERSYLLDGHYGVSTTFNATHKKAGGGGREDIDGAYIKATAGNTPHEGTVYVVAGCAGQISGGTLNHPAHFLSINTAGSVVVDVEDKRMDVKFLRYTTSAAAAPIYSDHFTILKSQPPPLPTAPSGLLALPLYGSQTALYWQDNATTESQQSILLSTDGITFQVVKILGPNEFQTTLTGLTAGQTYYAKVRATNASGSATSGAITFTQPFTPTPIEIWRFSYWGMTTPLGDRANDADPDGDGWVNLLEYALGTSPIVRTSVPVLTPFFNEQGELAIKFNRQAATDLSYRMEFSNELVEPWVSGYFSSGTENTLGIITAVTPLAGGVLHSFGRLRVTLVP